MPARPCFGSWTFSWRRDSLLRTNRRRRIVIAAAFIFAGLFWSAIYFGNSIAILLESDEPSESIGTPGSGSLRNGKRLPTSGENYRAYSRLGAALGRNSVHGDLRRVVLDAYSDLDSRGVGHRFVYGETGWPSGGRFRPHRTHQNGLSVDFMVPVVDQEGNPVGFPTSVFSRFGYDLEFDEQGRRNGMRIDFAAVSAHLMALDRAARARGLAVRQVIFAPEYRRHLRDPATGTPLEEVLPFMQGEAWVRHDEHYHVDFTDSSASFRGSVSRRCGICSLSSGSRYRCHRPRSKDTRRIIRP